MKKRFAYGIILLISILTVAVLSGCGGCFCNGCLYGCGSCVGGCGSCAEDCSIGALKGCFTCASPFVEGCESGAK